MEKLFYLKEKKYFKSFVLGLSGIVLPTFIQGGNVPKVSHQELTDVQKTKRDYAKSVISIEREAKLFGYKK